MIERAVKEPGLNDVMKLLELAQEAANVERIRVAMSEPQSFATVATGTAAWIR